MCKNRGAFVKKYHLYYIYVIQIQYYSCVPIVELPGYASNIKLWRDGFHWGGWGSEDAP